MASNQGRNDPTRELGAAPLRGESATKVLAALRDADLTETRLAPANPVAAPQAWFRDGGGTPWASRPSQAARVPDRRAERTGRIRIPEEFALDALRQEIGMKVRDHLAGHLQERLAGEILDRGRWNGIRAGFRQLAGEFQTLCETERADLREAWAEHDASSRELLVELDAHGVEKDFTGAVSRKLGIGIAQHSVTPWGALLTLKSHVDPVHWAPPPS